MFEAFFSAITSDTNPGMTFVLVQHLDRTTGVSSPTWSGAIHGAGLYKSGRMIVRPDCVYVIPLNHDMILQDSTLKDGTLKFRKFTATSDSPKIL